MIQVNLPMPDNCLDCPACNEYAVCAIPVDGKGFGEQDVSDFSDSRPDWCPLKAEHDMPCFNCPMNPIRPTYRDNKVYCGQCGKRIPLKINAYYCHKCGREIDWQP